MGLQLDPHSPPPVEMKNLPKYRVTDLTQGGKLAQIVLDDKTYTLRITRAGKLILTK